MWAGSRSSPTTELLFLRFLLSTVVLSARGAGRLSGPPGPSSVGRGDLAERVLDDAGGAEGVQAVGDVGVVLDVAVAVVGAVVGADVQPAGAVDHDRAEDAGVLDLHHGARALQRGRGRLLVRAVDVVDDAIVGVLVGRELHHAGADDEDARIG